MHMENMPTVLVVDDDREHTYALATVLERAGYCVCTAGNGEEALAVLAGRPVDLVISDLRMPRLNGLELLRSMQAMNPQVAVIILTAYGEWTTYMQAMNGGAADYLNKPVRRRDLLNVTRKALARREILAPGISAQAPEDPAHAVP